MCITSSSMAVLQMTTLEQDGFDVKTVNTFKNLIADETFTDVTLACEDGQQIKAHRIILASSSQLLRDILAKNPHPHPLLFIQGVQIQQLKNIISFIYLGHESVG